MSKPPRPPIQLESDALQSWETGSRPRTADNGFPVTPLDGGGGRRTSATPSSPNSGSASRPGSAASGKASRPGSALSGKPGSPSSGRPGSAASGRLSRPTTPGGTRLPDVNKVDQGEQVRLYDYETEDVIRFLGSMVPEKSLEKAREAGLNGADMLSCDEATVGDILQISGVPLTKVVEKWGKLRDKELERAPKLPAPARIKIENMRGGNINLSDMKLAAIPEQLFPILRIIALNMSQNKMRTVSNEIGLLTRIVSLKLASNKIYTLPDALGRLVSLQMCFLEENDLKTIPQSMQQCSALKVLDVSRNKIAMLPTGLWRCRKLNKINVYDNPMKLPKEVVAQGSAVILTMLKALNIAEKENALRLGSLQLVAIPEYILQLTSVTELALDDNKITDVGELHVLHNLATLSIEHNKIVKLPLSLATLTALTELRTEGNPLVSPPDEVIQLGAAKVVRYLGEKRSLITENVRDLYSAFDEDGSGSVSRKEMVMGLFKVSLGASKEDLLKVIDEADDDGNGFISMEEFKDILLKILAADPDAEQPWDLSSLGLPRFTVDLQEPHLVSSLDLSDNLLTDLPDSLSLLVGLKTLSLDENRLRHVPAPACMPWLVRLSLRGNTIDVVPEHLIALDTLAFLHFERNQIQVLPCNMVMMTGLQILSLDGNPMRMPLSALNEQGLDMIMAYLTIFNDSRSTGSLDLRDMDLLAVPAEAELEPLLEIFLGGNRFFDVPIALLDADHLTSLDVSNGRLHKVPPTIYESLTTLKNLNLSANKLRTVEVTVGFLQNLESLILRANIIVEIPSNISKLSSLTLLDIGANQVEILPDSVGNLISLKELIAFKNALTSIPAAIRLLTRLEVLDVSKNEIKRLPDVFDCLNLKTLSVLKCPLEEIPLSIGALATCLEDIHIDRHLHLNDPPDTIVSRGTRQLLGYLLRAYRARTTRQLDLAQLSISAITTPLQTLDLIAGGLIKIDCTNNNVQELPRSIGTCAYLQILILKDNRISTFPQSTKNMVTLTHLDISGNHFDAVPDMLTYTPRIKFLDMSRNVIKSLYRKLDTFTAGGFAGALSGMRRKKEKEAAMMPAVGKLKRTVAIEIMDQVQAKLQSSNRSKQVGALFQLHSLQSLSLAANSVAVLPGTIARFTGLTSLDMSHNNLPDVPPDLGTLTMLTHLDLSYNQLLGLPQTIQGLRALRNFDVSHNQIRLIPIEVGSMTSLRKLDVSENALVFLPVELEALETSLTSLQADGNKIRDPPVEVLGQGRDATFTYFRRVRNGQRSRELVLIDMHLEHLDLNWHNLTILTALELSGNQIDRLPTSILQLTNLQTLKASGNRMTKIVDSNDLSALSALTRLMVKDNNLPAIHDHLSALVNLKDLDCSSNKVSEIENGIMFCTHIKRLQLAENELLSLPKHLFRIFDIQFLNASYNNIRTVPFAMCFCADLKELDMSYNRLELLPQDFGNLMSLQYLNLSSNLLRALPESFRHCTSLQSLLLNDNKLAVLPPEIRRLKLLEVLQAKDNDLISVPPDIATLQKLRVLALEGNPLLTIPSGSIDLPKLQSLSANKGQLHARCSDPACQHGCRTRPLSRLEAMASGLTRPFLSWKGITKLLRARRNPGSVEDRSAMEESEEWLADNRRGFHQGDSVLQMNEMSESRLNLRKMPRTHSIKGLRMMAAFLDRLHQRESIPAFNLTHLQLTFIPAEVFLLSALTVLDLKENHLTEIPDSIANLFTLTHLDVSVNKLAALPDALRALTALEWLSFGRNNLTSLPAAFDSLENLKYLDVHVNHLGSLLPPAPKEAGHVKDVFKAVSIIDEIVASQASEQMEHEKQVAGSNATVGKLGEEREQIVEAGMRKMRGGMQKMKVVKGMLDEVRGEVGIMEGLVRLHSITDLECSYNELEGLPDMAAMLSLTRINCAHNRLRDLPNVICNIHTLVKLECGDNRVRRVPQTVSRLTRLTLLSLKNNNLRELPSEIGDCVALKHLSLNANDIVSLPDALTSLASLKRLQIGANNCRVLPEALGRLASLSHIDLSSNPISTLPASLGALHLTLENIELFECKELKDPPEAVVAGGHQQTMEYLRKVWRGFTSGRMVLVGLEMQRLELDLLHPNLLDLAELRVDKNGLKFLPDQVAMLPSLISLRFRDNLVQRLPDSFTNLSNLKELDMSKNKFHTLPKCVIALTHLTRLRCGNNPIPFSLSAEWIEGGVDSFLRDYILETTGKRIAAMWSSAQTGEAFTAWANYVQEAKLERAENPDTRTKDRH